MNRELEEKILKETQTGYDLISEKFSQTRKNFWKELEFIANYCQPGDRVLDFGCGSGRLWPLLEKRKVSYLGLDISKELIKLAWQQYPEEAQRFQKLSDWESLPLKANSFNVVYAVAVFHHFPGQERRQKMARELFRVLRPGGKIILTVWNLWQGKYVKKIFSNWKHKFLGQSALDWNDCYVDFQDNAGAVFRRYHHAFTRGELRRNFSQAGFFVDKCDIIDRRNLFLMGKK